MKIEEKKLQQILKDIKTKKYNLALLQIATLLKQFPRSADLLNLNGIVHARTGHVNEAIENFESSIRFDPENIHTYYNLANAQKEQGLGKKAILNYKKVIALDPKYVHAYRNIANIYLEEGNINNAFSYFEKALELQPNFTDGIFSLIQTLTTHQPTSLSRNAIISIDRKIRDRFSKIKPSDRFEEQKIKSFFNNCLSIINQSSIPSISFPKTQIFRANNTAPDCGRHMSLFKKEKIIPEYCFGCFKVQIEPKNVVDLIKLHFLFDEINLTNNNSRKCMIETRSDVKGFYKGLIYFNSLEEALEICPQLDRLLADKISDNLKSSVKRGCSEYAAAYPQFAELPTSQDRKMTYNENWRSIETSFDASNSILPSPKRHASLSGICLHDIMVIYNWLAYAKQIGDASADKIKDNITCPSFLKSLITARSNFNYLN